MLFLFRIRGVYCDQIKAIEPRWSSTHEKNFTTLIHFSFLREDKEKYPTKRTRQFTASRKSRCEFPVPEDTNL